MKDIIDIRKKTAEAAVCAKVLSVSEETISGLHCELTKNPSMLLSVQIINIYIYITSRKMLECSRYYVYTKSIAIFSELLLDFQKKNHHDPAHKYFIWLVQENEADYCFKKRSRLRNVAKGNLKIVLQNSVRRLLRRNAYVIK